MEYANKQEGYGTNNSYGSSNYQSSNLPIYQSKTRKSKCPRGAPLGSIGTCCGMQCTRACALES